MAENGLMSFAESARALGIQKPTIADAVKLLGLTPKKMSNGKAKGLDQKDRNTIRKALRIPSKQQLAATA
ncbi:hypothetical protein [Singulisphaera sp. PoT]|uniref:hypothetical protein n=1 Tax=Singulisphaera sp. PoT TaxID=3411797 RepID=UPI003BF51A1E